MSDYYDDMDDDDIIEGYCVRDKLMVEIENPEAVWTRKGMAATRGECPLCGGTVFRMGKTYLHDGLTAPPAVEVTGSTKRKHAKLPQDTIYILYADADEAIAQQIAADLEKSGLKAWLHEPDDHGVAWAGGVHPALKQCNRMLYLLSAEAATDASIAQNWQFFKEKRKPILVAQVGTADTPDALRRAPRFDFTSDDDFKTTFRQMMQALG
ncbi:MAG: hypothetical protein OHK0046_16850 [Anaerolineae bacterium]